MVSIKQALIEAKSRLAGSSASPGLDADLLMQNCLGKSLGWILTHGDEPLRVRDEQHFRRCVERRHRGEPLAYITGYKEFWSLELALNPTVLIPRPETEHLVEHALAKIPATGTLHILDLGTGSGAVDLAIAKERPRCRITASDVSRAILRIATDNAERLGIGNIEFTLSDWFDGLAGHTFDVIVANPPYVADDDACLRQPGLKFEPLQALQAGAKGLDALSVIAAKASAHLKPNGWLLIEHGCDQRHEVASIFATNDWEDIVCHFDHAGLPRITECRAVPRTA